MGRGSRSAIYMKHNNIKIVILKNKCEVLYLFIFQHEVVQIILLNEIRKYKKGSGVLQRIEADIIYLMISNVFY